MTDSRNPARDLKAFKMFSRYLFLAEERKLILPGWVARNSAIALAFAMLLLSSGCGGGGSSPNPGIPQQGLASPPAPSQINSYIGTTGDIWTSKLDHIQSQINGEDTTLHGILLAGSIIGTFNPSGGFLSLDLTKVPNELTGQTTGFALEIPGEAALVRYGDNSKPLIPLAQANACAIVGGTVTYSYVTIPDGSRPPKWVPATDSTYGTFQVSVDGSNWNISNITQFTLTGQVPADPGTGLPAGFCGIGAAGYAVTASSSAINPPVATVSMGFGQSGFFLEDNGSAQAQPAEVVPSNAIGAGVGAVGVIQPPSPVDTRNLVGGHYLGFYYEPGTAGGGAVTQLASFGCSGSTCAPPPAPTAIVGGVFPNDDPTLPAGQNITVDLGTQDANNNGLYPSATVTVSGVNFPAAAVVGTLQGKYVLFLITEDTINNVPLAIYLFQQ